VPAYTLEALDNCDIERILPYYFFDYRKSLRECEASSSEVGEVVTRNGKQYRVVTANNASWIDDIF